MKVVLFIAIALVAASWQSVIAGETKTFIVAPKKVDCFGIVPQKCLEVKESRAEDWTNFYGDIEGFNYEPGYEYELKVQAEDIDNPPADAPSVKFTLLEQVSKTKM